MSSKKVNNNTAISDQTKIKPEQLSYFEEALTKEKEHLIQVINRLEETGIGDNMADSLSELSMYDNHPADISDAVFERSKDIALRDNEHILLEKVEHALDKIQSGSYGICDNCGQSINTERLKAMPMATLCIKCQENQDIIDATPRPLEEEVLTTPFFDKAKNENVGFDGEDAIEAVMSYGSSDSPQDILGNEDYKQSWAKRLEHDGLVELTDALPNPTNDAKNDAD